MGSPNLGQVKLPIDPSRSDIHEALCTHLNISDADLILGPLLLIHWRNRIIHKTSRASLTNNQKLDFTNAADVIFKKYKNLSVDQLLDHFKDNLPTLKDISSLIAMSINFVKLVENKVPEPKSKNDFEGWLKHLKLYDEYERITRVATSKPNPEGTIKNFLVTNCPELLNCYDLYV